MYVLLLGYALCRRTIEGFWRFLFTPRISACHPSAPWNTHSGPAVYPQNSFLPFVRTCREAPQAIYRLRKVPRGAPKVCRAQGPWAHGSHVPKHSRYQPLALSDRRNQPDPYGRAPPSNAACRPRRDHSRRQQSVVRGLHGAQLGRRHAVPRGPQPERGPVLRRGSRPSDGGTVLKIALGDSRLSVHDLQFWGFYESNAWSVALN